jgi:hypothetical protein
VRISCLVCRRVARDLPVLVASGRTEMMLWNRLKLLRIFFLGGAGFQFSEDGFLGPCFC